MVGMVGPSGTVGMARGVDGILGNAKRTPSCFNEPCTHTNANCLDYQLFLRLTAARLTRQTSARGNSRRV
eukprot:8650691-Lingulodinium_polyedra.AAC.1